MSRDDKHSRLLAAIWSVLQAEDDTPEFVVAMQRMRRLYDEVRATPSHVAAPALHVQVAEMGESNGKVTWIVYLKLTEDAAPWDSYQVYDSTIKGRAEYEAARLKHFLGQAPEPDMSDFDVAAPRTECCGLGYKAGISECPGCPKRSAPSSIEPIRGWAKCAPPIWHDTANGMLAQWHNNRPEIFVRIDGQWWFCLLPRPDEGLPSATRLTGYYIACFRHPGRGHMLWWGPDKCGYTPDLAQAGVYEDTSWCGVETEDVPVPVAFAEKLRIRRMVDVSDSLNACLHSPEALRLAINRADDTVKP